MEEQSFGIIPVAKRGGEWEVFLIQHRRGRHWGFPKGHAEKGESGLVTAVRELKEETHLDVVSYLIEEPLVEHYQFVHEKRTISKQVSYYAALVEGEVILQTKEIHDGAWFPLAQAMGRLTHPEGKAILREVEKILRKL